MTRSSVHRLRSPIRNLASSLAASSSGRTIVAIRIHDDNDHDHVDNDGDSDNECLLVLSYSDLHLNIQNTDYSNNNDYFNYPVGSNLTRANNPNNQNQNANKNQIPIRSKSILSSSPSNTLHTLSSSSSLMVLGTTGLQSDVHHILRSCASTLAQSIHFHHTHTHTHDTHSFTRKIVSPVLRQAAWRGNSRPYAMEVLILGLDKCSYQQQKQQHQQHSQQHYQQQHSQQPKPKQQFGMYTVDASGNWKHWGGGATSIGKNAALVRNVLSNSLNSLPSIHLLPTHWKQAMHIALHAIVHASYLSSSLSSSSSGNNDNDTIVPLEEDARQILEQMLNSIPMPTSSSSTSSSPSPSPSFPKYEAMLVFSNGNCHSIPTYCIDDCYRQCLQSILKGGKKGNKLSTQVQE